MNGDEKVLEKERIRETEVGSVREEAFDLVCAGQGWDDGSSWDGGEVGWDGEMKGSKLGVGEKRGEGIGGRETGGRLQWARKKEESRSAAVVCIAQRQFKAVRAPEEAESCAYLLKEPLEAFQRVDLDLDVQSRSCFREKVLRDSAKTSESSLIRALEDDAFLDLEGEVDLERREGGEGRGGRREEEGGGVELARPSRCQKREERGSGTHSAR